MQIAHIVPTDLLDIIDNRQFYMCLANIASKDKAYLNYYKEQSKRGAFVLLDNGAAEQDQMSLDIMWKVIEEINPSEVILNDVLFDIDETLKRSKESLAYYKSKGYKGQYMFIPQGRNMSEWFKCFYYMDLDNISTIGIPKLVNSRWNNLSARYELCTFLETCLNNKQVHLLGCQENIKEVQLINNSFDFIRSCDTALAFIYAQQYQPINAGNRPAGNINFYKSGFNTTQIRYLEKNIQIFDKNIR